MKVLLLIDHLGAGGAQRQLVGLASMLKEKGMDVCVYTYYHNMFYGEQLQRYGVSCKVIEGADSHWKRFFLLRKKILSTKPDWIVAYLDTPCLMASLVRFFGGKFKLIVSERNTTQVLTRRERLKFWLYRKADYIVPNSYSQGDFIKSHFPEYKEKIVVIPNFVDLDKFSFSGVRHCRRPAIILVAASVWASKNAKGLIEAVRLLRQRRDDFVIKWFGLHLDTQIPQNKVYQEDCLRMVKEYGLEDKVFFYEKTKHIDEEYRKADFFCLPSFYEGTPNVLCEAMACSMPIICSNVCDNPKYVSDGGNGFLFNPKDPKEMAEKMDTALSLSDVVYGEFGSRSRIIAEQNMSEGTFVEKYLSLINFA